MLKRRRSTEFGLGEIMADIYKQHSRKMYSCVSVMWPSSFILFLGLSQNTALRDNTSTGCTFCRGGYLSRDILVAPLIQSSLFSFVRDCNGRTPLHFAAACGHVGILNGLLQVVGSGVHMDNHGYTPLHWACFNGTS